MRKSVVLLFLAIFLFGFKNSSDAFENSNIPDTENCGEDYMSYCLEHKSNNYCENIVASYTYC
jgi:hypothetical protein